MDNIKEFINKARRKKNTDKLIIETLKDEKIELLERIIQLRDNEDAYKEENKKLKARNKKLAKQVKELKEKLSDKEKE